MAYFLNLFTVETWAKFHEHGSNVSGFSIRQRRIARERIKPGDFFLCYLVRLSRWCGVLQIDSSAYHDETPILRNPDPYVIRFKVKPIIVLEPKASVPIFTDEVWHNLRWSWKT